MVENSPYLSAMLGESAQITILRGAHTLYGEFNQQAVLPLQDIKHNSSGMACLEVKPEHMNDSTNKHFPEYRLLELGASVGDRIKHIQNAKFHNAVQSGDVLKAFRNNDSVCVIKKNREHLQETAEATMIFNDDGLLPHKVGIMLEVASQTAIANVFDTMPEFVGMFPTIDGFGDMYVSNSELTRYVTAQPNGIEQIGEYSFLAHAEVKSDHDRLLASLHEMIITFHQLPV